MKTLDQVLVFGCVSMLVATVSIAGPCCNTPTIWTLKNETKQSLTLECKLESSTAWTAKEAVSFATPAIASGATVEHKWGSDWYNDGMGMIPGKWSCKATKGTLKGPVQFATDWGENITITLNDAKSIIAKTADSAKPSQSKN